MKKTMFAMGALTMLFAAACDGGQVEVAPDPDPDSCDDYLTPDYAAPPPAEFVVVNNTGSTVYIDDGSCGYPGYQLYEDGQQMDLPGGLCDATCEELQQGAVACPAIDCALEVVAIAPGGRYPMEWSGFRGREVEMPRACYAEPEFAGPTCTMIEVAESTRYEFGILAYPGLDCDSLDDSCDCTPNVDGYCTTMHIGGGPEGEPLPVRSGFDYPTDGPVEIVIE